MIRHICKIIPVYEEQISVKACQIIHSLTAKQQVTIELQIFIVWNFMTWSFPDQAINLLFKNMFAKCWEKKKTLYIYVFNCSQLSLEEQVLRNTTEFLISAVQRISHWATAEILQTLGAVVYENVDRLSQVGYHS